MAHKIGRSPYLYETQSGDFFYENVSRQKNSQQHHVTMGPSIRPAAFIAELLALFTLYFGIASESDVVEPGDDMPLYAFSRWPRVINCCGDADSNLQTPSFVLEVVGHCAGKTLK